MAQNPTGVVVELGCGLGLVTSATMRISDRFRMVKMIHLSFHP